jgi:hypothetical protein
MPYTMEDFTRDFVSEHIHVLSADEVLNRYSPEKRLEGLSPEILRAFLEQLENQKKSKE